MGVWIEGFLEVVRDGAWYFSGRMIPNFLYDPEEPEEEPEMIPEPLFTSEHKELSAILGGPFRTIRSHEPYVPIAEARGLPADASPEIAARLGARIGNPGFAATWYTARELLDFDWTGRIMRRRAMVDPRAAHLFTKGRRGFPWQEWPKDVEVGCAEWLRDGVPVEWEESYAEIADELCSDVLPRLRMQGPADEVRIVLCFDW